MAQALPWVEFLPDNGTDQLMEELVATLRASITIDNVWPVSQLLIEWRHPAEIYADPSRHAEVTRQLGADGGPVPRPRAVPDAT